MVRILPRFQPGGKSFIGPVLKEGLAPAFKPGGSAYGTDSFGYHNQGSVLGANTSSGSGGQAPQNNQNLNLGDVMQPQPEQPQIDFDALIAPAIQGLDEAIAPLQKQTDTRIGDIQAQGNTAVQGAQQEFAGQEQGLTRAKTDASQRGESAADEARRQYAEVSQGLQSRYGGTTGTGRFANEILGSQTLRNIANIRTQVSGAITQIDDKIQQVQEIGRIAVQDIQDKTRQQINDARANLDTQLADIRRQKGEIQSRKAELAANAVQMYQQTVQQVNANNAQFLQGLYSQQQAAQQQLTLAKQRASQVAASVPELKLQSLNAGQTLVGYNPQDQTAQPLFTAPAGTTSTSESSTGDPELDKILGL